MRTLDVDGAKIFPFSIEDYQEFESILRELSMRVGATLVILSDVNGQVLSQYGRNPRGDTIAASALSAGSFAATQELAEIIGEKKKFHVQFISQRKVQGFSPDVRGRDGLFRFDEGMVS